MSVFRVLLQRPRTPLDVECGTRSRQIKCLRYYTVVPHQYDSVSNLFQSFLCLVAHCNDLTVVSLSQEAVRSLLLVMFHKNKRIWNRSCTTIKELICMPPRTIDRLLCVGYMAFRSLPFSSLGEERNL